MPELLTDNQRGRDVLRLGVASGSEEDGVGVEPLGEERVGGGDDGERGRLVAGLEGLLVGVVDLLAIGEVVRVCARVDGDHNVNGCGNVLINEYVRRI